MTCAVLAVGVIVVLALGWRAGVEVDHDTVTVRTYRGTSTTIPWAEVSRFESVSNGSGGVYIAVIDREPDEREGSAHDPRVGSRTSHHRA